MIILRLFSKILRDKNAIKVAEDRLKGMKPNHRRFLKNSLEKTVRTSHPEKVVNDNRAFKLRLGRTIRNLGTDQELSKSMEGWLGNKCGSRKGTTINR